MVKLVFILLRFNWLSRDLLCVPFCTSAMVAKKSGATMGRIDVAVVMSWWIVRSR